MTPSRSRVRALGVALALGVLLALTTRGPALPTAAATPKPTDTPTAVPTQTPYPTNTPAATYTPYPSPTATHRPALALSATSGMTDTNLVAAGSDFPPHTAVTLYWDNDAHALATSETDEGGHVRLDVTIPAYATTGGH